jgi:threonine dehydrogenase-like Zn-dependent dehydrogenase
MSVTLRPDQAVPLITRRFPLEAYQEAYQVLREGSGPTGKVMLDVNAP